VVVLHHTWGNAVPGILQPIHAYGWMGVDLFFVLSGYLIGSQLLRQYAAGRAPSLADFYVRRGFRILPAYMLVLAIYSSAPSLREQPKMVPLWRFLSFTMNLGFDRSEGAAFSHAWSLCVEEHFYLLFPLVCILLMRRPSVKGPAVAAGCIVVAGAAIRLFSWIWLVGPVVRLHGADAAMEAVYPEYIYYPTYTRLDGLLAGVTLAAIKVFRPGWWGWAMQRGHSLEFAGLSLVAYAVWLFAERVFILLMAYSFTYRCSVCRDIPSILQISATDVLVSAYSFLASLIFSGDSAFGRPPSFPLVLAASSPALVRSLMMSRSNSASAPKM
jgi:peptidoglycan/LPS O-acetylase OafA/YrhL